MPTSHDIISLCQRLINPYSNDCSGFVKAVATECGIFLNGNANEIMDYVSSVGSPWQEMEDGIQAKEAAASGKLVVAGLKEKGHGHIVIVVDGPLTHQKYPYAFWGQFHGVRVLGKEENFGFTRGHGAISWAFGKDKRDRVAYYAISPLTLLTPRAEGVQGNIIYY